MQFVNRILNILTLIKMPCTLHFKMMDRKSCSKIQVPSILEILVEITRGTSPRAGRTLWIRVLEACLGMDAISVYLELVEVRHFCSKVVLILSANMPTLDNLATQKKYIRSKDSF